MGIFQEIDLRSLSRAMFLLSMVLLVEIFLSVLPFEGMQFSY